MIKKTQDKSLGKLLLNHALEDLFDGNIKKVKVRIFPFNKECIKFAEKMGFKKETEENLQPDDLIDFFIDSPKQKTNKCSEI